MKDFNQYDIVISIVVASCIFLMLVCFCIALILVYKKRKTQHQQEKTILSQEFQQALLQTQLEIQEQTLKTISEEIHDNVGQVLSLAKLNLNTVDSITDQQTQSKINSTKDLVSKAINDLRDLSRSLYGEKIGETGLQEAIANELKILQNTGQFETELHFTGEVYKSDPQKEMVLFRIVQEALHNAVKHAHATHLKVKMIYQPASFTLTIKDDGKGFSPEALESSQTGIGLKSMQNRAALIGAEFLLQSSEKNGTSITIELPNLNP